MINSLIAVLENYPQYSGYQGEESKCRIKIIEFTLKFLQNSMGDELLIFQPISNPSPLKKLMESLISGINKTFDIDQLKVLMKKLSNPNNENVTSKLLECIKDSETQLLEAMRLHVNISNELTLLESSSKPALELASCKIRLETIILRRGYVLYAMHIVNESPYLRELFETTCKSGTISTALNAVLEEYSNKSGYQGDELFQHLEILELAVKCTKNLNDKHSKK